MCLRHVPQAKREAIKKLREQAAQETDPAKKEALLKELAAAELEAEKIENTIKLTEEQDTDFETKLFDRQRKADKIVADFEKNNAEFDKSMQAEMARRAELLKQRREAAKVCETACCDMCVVR